MYLDLEDKPRLGHMHTLIDARTERPKSRLGLLDYLAPEMFSVKLAGQAELEVLGAQPDSWNADQQMRDQQPNAWDPDLATMSPSLAKGRVSSGGSPDLQPKQQQQFKQPSSPSAAAMLQGRPRSPMGSQGGAPRSPRGVLRPMSPMGSAPGSPRGVTRVREPAVCLPNAAAGSDEDEEDDIAADARSLWPETGSPIGGSLAGDSADAEGSRSKLGDDAQKAEDEDEEEEDEEDMSPLQRKLLMKGGPTKKWKGKSPVAPDGDGLEQPAEVASKQQLEQRKGGQQQEEEGMVPYERASWEQQDCYDHKVDIWQVGCLMHELLFGCLPFEVRGAASFLGPHGVCATHTHCCTTAAAAAHSVACCMCLLR